MPFPFSKLSIKKLINKSRVLNTAAGFVPSLVILRYHSVKENPAEHDSLLSDGIIHSLDSFTKQMEILARDYQPVSMDDVVSIISGKIKMPRKAVVVAFDDGYADNLEIAAPVLNHFGIKGIFYLTVGSIGSGLAPWYVRLRYGLWKTEATYWSLPGSEKQYSLHSRDDRMNAFIDTCHFCSTLNHIRQKEFVETSMALLRVNDNGAYDGLMMNWNQAMQLLAMGHLVGSHSVSHPNLAYIESDDAKYEIVHSRKLLEDNLNTKIVHLCYPNPALEPNFNRAIMMMAEEAGYATAVCNMPGHVTKKTKKMALSRLRTPDSVDSFVWDLNSTFIGRVL